MKSAQIRSYFWSVFSRIRTELTPYLDTFHKWQGICGKSDNEDEMIIRCYGTITWQSKVTGREDSKYGLMYLHFHEKCLKILMMKIIMVQVKPLVRVLLLLTQNQKGI